MGRLLVSSPRFRSSYRKLDRVRQEMTDKALRQLQEYLGSGLAPIGLGLKKLGPGVFEIRVGLSLRIVLVEDESRIILDLLGTHDEVRRYLRK